MIAIQQNPYVVFGDGRMICQYCGLESTLGMIPSIKDPDEVWSIIAQEHTHYQCRWVVARGAPLQRLQQLAQRGVLDNTTFVLYLQTTMGWTPGKAQLEIDRAVRRGKLIIRNGTYWME